MKTILAGSRDIADIELVRRAVASCPWVVTEVVSGTARGVDRLGEEVAEELGYPVKRFPADWKRLGLAAGHIRNGAMADYADRAIILWDGASKGTSNMIRAMHSRHKQVHLVRTDIQKSPSLF